MVVSIIAQEICLQDHSSGKPNLVGPLYISNYVPLFLLMIQPLLNGLFSAFWLAYDHL